MCVPLRSAGMFAWERWGEPWLEARGLRERERRRAAGERFDEDTNLDDLFRWGCAGLMSLGAGPRFFDWWAQLGTNSSRGKLQARCGQGVGFM